MVDSGFVQFKLDSKEIQSLAPGAALEEQPIRTPGEHSFSVFCYPRGLPKDVVHDHHHHQDDDDDLPLHLFLAIKSGNINPVFEAFLVVTTKAAHNTIQAKKMRTTTEKATAAATTHRGLRAAALLGFLKRSDLELLWAANGGTVTLVCGAIVLPRDDGGGDGGNTIPLPASDIRGCLAHMLGCADGSDVSFSVGGETFHAHRAVLAARSPVFRAELFGSMAEARTPCVTVHGVEPLIFKTLLHFVYMDALPETRECLKLVRGASAMDFFQHLLAAADRYALDRLKLLCARKLWEIVSVDTVAVVLTCAETYDCRELKDNCMGFLVAEKNFKTAMLTEGFADLVHKFPSIIAELRKRAGI